MKSLLKIAHKRHETEEWWQKREKKRKEKRKSDEIKGKEKGNILIEEYIVFQITNRKYIRYLYLVTYLVLHIR